MKKVSVLVSVICVFLLSLCVYAAESAVSYTMEDAANAPTVNGLIVTPSISADGDTVTAAYDVSNRSDTKKGDTVYGSL